MLELVPEEDIKPKRSLIEHHIKYKEIHGEDKTIFMPLSEHIRLHRRLRKEGKCKISPELLHEASSRACARTEKSRMRAKERYQLKQSEKAKYARPPDFCLILLPYHRRCVICGEKFEGEMTIICDPCIRFLH